MSMRRTSNTLECAVRDAVGVNEKNVKHTRMCVAVRDAVDVNEKNVKHTRMCGQRCSGCQ